MTTQEDWRLRNVIRSVTFISVDSSFPCCNNLRRKEIKDKSTKPTTSVREFTSNSRKRDSDEIASVCNFWVYGKMNGNLWSLHINVIYFDKCQRCTIKKETYYYYSQVVSYCNVFILKMLWFSSKRDKRRPGTVRFSVWYNCQLKHWLKFVKRDLRVLRNQLELGDYLLIT